MKCHFMQINPSKPLTNGCFQVMDYYHESNDHDFDRETPDDFSAGLVPPGRIGAWWSVERVRPGQGWFVDPAGESTRKTGHRKTPETSPRQPAFGQPGGSHCKSSVAPGA